MASIAVVGGGVAGLACAWRLRRAGYDVEVLEREPEPGGRFRSVERAGFRLNEPAAVAPGDRNLAATVRALGIERRLTPLPRRDAAVLIAGHLHAPTRLDFLRSRQLARAARVRLAAALLRDVLRYRARLDRMRPELAADLDTGSAAAELARRAGSPDAAAALAPLLQLRCDAAPDALAWPVALTAWREADAAAGSFALDADALVAGLRASLRVRGGCHVTSVETETGGARIRYLSRGRERCAWADAVVMALPGSGVSDVCSKLTPEERGFLTGVATRRSVTAHLLLEHPPPSSVWREIAVPASERLDLARIRLGSHGSGVAPPGSGLVSVALAPEAAERCWESSDASVADLALESLAATPVGALAPRDYAVCRHPAVAAPFVPGSLRRLARFRARLERSPRLAFAGDYLVGPGLEGAVTSGMRAATEVVRSLSEPGAAKTA